MVLGILIPNTQNYKMDKILIAFSNIIEIFYTLILTKISI